MSEELKKCPFCGVHVLYWVNPDTHKMLVRCINADCPMHRKECEMDMEWWQSRPFEDALQVKLDDAMKAIKAFIGRFDDTDDTSMDATIYVIEGLREALKKLDE